MRLATWNCCGKFAANLEHLLSTGVDVAVVCEASHLAEWPVRDGRPVQGLGRRVWQESWKELAVVARQPWALALHPHAERAPGCALPVAVSGPRDFTLVALWPVIFPGTPGYVAQVDAALDWVEQHAADEDVVVAGDFNAPIAGSLHSYLRVAERFAGLGLVDAYQAARGLEPDEPMPEATYYQWRQAERGFHIDHVLLPATWAEGAEVTVGDFDIWIASGRSDHVPLTVDLPARG